MTTPLGVPNLPLGALTVDTLHDKLQDQSQAAIRSRAGERMPAIFHGSTGGNILNDLTPFGILTNIWSGINSKIANAAPEDIQGPEDIPGLLLDFIEGLPVIGEFVNLLEALLGNYDGDNTALLTIQTLLSPLITFFEGLIDALKGDYEGNNEVLVIIQDLLSPVLAFVEKLMNPGGDSGSSWLKPPNPIANPFAGGGATGRAVVSRKIAAAIPATDELAYALTGDAEASLDLGGIGTWARAVLHERSAIPAGNLFGTISESAFGVIPVANINTASPNLLNQGSFNASATVEDADGWSWDGDENHSGDGGSVKVTADSTLLELFSNQSIPVAKGDLLEVSAWIKTLDFAGSGLPIELSIIPFIGTAQQTTVVINSGGSSPSWSQITGEGSYEVPADITSVRVRLAVTADATAGTIWWDDISLTKTGLLQQPLVDNLTNSWQALHNNAFGTPTDTTERTWEDIGPAANNLLTQAGIGISKGDQAIGFATTLQNKLSGGWTIDTITSNGDVWNNPGNILTMWAVCFGGGAKGTSGVSSGGNGGEPGDYVAQQINPQLLPSSVTCTIGPGSTTSKTVTAFGSIISTVSETPGYIGMPLGYFASVSFPAAGGAGGSSGSGSVGSVARAGTVGASAWSASGGTAGSASTGSSIATGGVGGNGSNAPTSGSAYSGGAGGGGGGGAYITSTSSGAVATGGNGGSGGFPGGGGGGGGGANRVSGGTGTLIQGTGGNGGNGVIFLIYQRASTV